MTAGVDGTDGVWAVEFLDFTDRDVFLDRAARTFASGDGASDILWRHASGQTVIWGVIGETVVITGATNVQVGPAWSILGTGDFGGDGRDDILWRNNNGLTVLWEMDGANVIDASVTSIQVGNDWGIV